MTQTTEEKQAMRDYLDALQTIKDQIGWHEGPDIRQEVMELIDLLKSKAVVDGMVGASRV